MKNSTISKQWSNTTDLYSTNAAKSHRLSMLWLMLLMLLLVPTRMVAQTTTDPRCALFNNLDGITDVTITDNSGNPWQMLDLNAEGMTNLGFDIPKGSKGLMSSNYNKDYSISVAFVKFKVEKPMLLTFKYLVSSKKSDQATITLDSKTYGTISEKKQIEIKALLSVGKHSLVLSYRKDPSGKAGADRAFIYDLKTATTISDYVAECDATNTTLTFKYFTSDNLGSLNFKHIAIVNNERTVQDVCTYYDCIKNIVFDESFKKYAPTSLRNFFKNCKALETISNLENLNTTKVTDMSYMFNGCNNLSSLDLSYFNTTNVTNMKHMFEGCKALTSLDLTNFNTEKVTDMACMFFYCQNLSSLDISYYFNTTNVTNMISMFYYCQNLSSLDLSYFNTTNVTDMYSMFKGCSALTSLDLTKFNTAKVTDMSGMFYDCKKLSLLDLTNFNTAKVTKMTNMFNNCQKLSSLDLSYFNTANVTDMYSMFSNCSALTTIYVSDKFVTGQVIDGSNMFKGCENLKGYSNSKIDHTYANCGTDGYFTPGCAYAEYDLSSKTLTFKCGLSKPAGAYDLNVGNNTPEWRREKEPEHNNDDEYIFPGEKIDISKVVFDASFANARPTSCYEWFDDCYSLTEIEGIENLNTEEVTNMGSMFHACEGLTSLDVSNFNTQKVEDMSDMFYASNGLTSLDVSNFNTQNVTDMSYMFSACPGLKSLNVSNFDTQKVKNMSNMFYSCRSLTSLDVSNFNTQKVENMHAMFSWCTGLNSIDLSNFDTQNVKDMSRMFWNSSALTTIYVSDKFVTTKVSRGSEMFKVCTNLKGFIEYNKNKDKDNHTYANYVDGYFTKLVVRNGDERYGITGETTQLTVDNLVLADNKDFVAYEPFTATAASYNRTIKEGTTWATLCLPFEVSLADQNFRAFKLLSANDATETVELEELKTIEAGTPVIIKMKDGATKLDFSVANKNIAKDIQTSATADGNYQLQGLYTQKEFSKDADNNCYIVKGNKLMNPAKLLENTKVTRVVSTPFRAYMVDNSSSIPAGAKMFSIGISDSTTAIDTLNTIANDKAEYFDLQGKRLNAPQKGINIVKRNGKTMKVIIK